MLQRHYVLRVFNKLNILLRFMVMISVYMMNSSAHSQNKGKRVIDMQYVEQFTGL